MLTPLQTMKLARYFRVYDVVDDGRVGLLDFERVLENVRVLNGTAAGSPRDQTLREAFMQRWEALRDSADTNQDMACPRCSCMFVAASMIAVWRSTVRPKKLASL